MREEKADRYAQLALRFHGSEGQFELVVGLTNLADVREAFARRGYAATPTERSGRLWVEKTTDPAALTDLKAAAKVERLAERVLRHIRRNLMSNAVAAAHLDASPEEIHLLRVGRYAELCPCRVREMVQRVTEDEATHPVRPTA